MTARKTKDKGKGKNRGKRRGKDKGGGRGMRPVGAAWSSDDVLMERCESNGWQVFLRSFEPNV